MAAQSDQIREWREQYARRWLSIDFEPLTDAPFRALVEPVFEDPRIVRLGLSPGYSFRDDDLVRDGNEAFSLMFSLSRSLDITHHRHELRLGRGDATLLHVCETGAVGSRQDFGCMTVLIPQSEFETRVARPDDAVMRHLPRRSEALQLLRAYLRSIERNRLGASPEVREIIRLHIIDLVALAITPHGALGESTLSAVAAARLNAALDYIATRFQDPEVSITAIARSQGVSPRYLQRLIETTGASFTERVKELRLQRAFMLLTEAFTCKRRISDIALQAGFSDLSHFNRLFRSRFGDTPRGVRAQGSQGAIGAEPPSKADGNLTGFSS